MVELYCEADWHEVSGGLHVLIEAQEWSHRQALTQTVSGAGHTPVSCPGPSGDDNRCGLAAEGRCDAAERADVIIHALPRHDLRNLEALRALRQRLPETPVIVEVPRVVAEQHPDDYRGAIVIHAPMTSSALLDALATLS